MQAEAAAPPAPRPKPAPVPVQPARVSHEDPLWVRWTLTFLAVAVVTILVIVPVVHVFYAALSLGLGVYCQKLLDPDTLHAVGLTLLVAPAAVALNLVFGIAAAWCIARFQFPGRTLLVTLIDVPFAVSPVAAGLMFVLLFGLQGWFGPALLALDVRILFAWPALVLVTAFTTLPFVARELIPLMEALGSEEETAAVSLGASGWQMFWKVTVPNIKWGLVYGIILCNARAMGEFGAVYVVSGHISGQTDTMPLRVEKLFQEYDLPGAFAVASVLTFLALGTLFVKTRLEHHARLALAEATMVRDVLAESAAAEEPPPSSASGAGSAAAPPSSTRPAPPPVEPPEPMW